MAAPIEKLAAVPPFPADFQQEVYDLLAAAESDRIPTARFPGVTVEVELGEAA